MMHRYAGLPCPVRRSLLRHLHWQLLLLLVVLLPTRAAAQAFPMFNGTTNTCTGAFLDSGGQGAGGYSNNEDITYTICPDAPGGAISVNWATFNLATNGANPDNMSVYDGNSTSAPLLGNWTGTGLQGTVVSASGGNPTGCLTFVFHSNANGTGVFAGSITCYQPCTRPTAVATHGANPQLICPGEAVTFNSSGSFAAAGFSIASRRWDFGDGSVQNNAPASVNHTYAQPGAYTAQLYVVDNNGCASTNLVDLVTMVGTHPTFPGTGGTLSGCTGETLCLNGSVTGTTWNELPDVDLGGGVFLPDNVGDCFSSELVFTQFAPGQTLTNINQLGTICLDIEHSFIGDLIISIIAPTGETVILHQQGGGATFLGEPVDDDLTPNQQGVCYTYCWSPAATNGTWVDNAGATLPAGTYESLNPLNGLVGAQLNGTWTIEVCDMWASDNGFICNWGIDFDPSLYDDLITFTPVYGAGCDSTYWTGPNITSSNANCEQACVTPPAPGNYNYVYHVTDNFGCSYDTTLTVTIVAGPQVTAGPDASTCNTPVQLGASVISGGYPTTCNYVLTLYDDFGDGWTGLLGLGSNGSSVTVTVNGVPQSWTLPNGSQGSVNIAVASGSTISLSYTQGSLYNDEQSFTLFNSAGGVVYASPLDPNGGPAWSGTANCPGGNFVYSWTPTAGLNNPNIPNPIATVAGTTQYCVTVYQQGHPSCTSTDCMTITVDQTVSAGTNGSVALCSNSAAINLFAQLGGSPTAGGTWTAPGGAAHSSTFTPGADPTGIYTYTVGGAGACGTPVNSTVNVTVYPLPNAGFNSSIAVCSTDATQALFPLLGASAMAGGTWTAPGGGAFSGNFNPAVNAAGVYTYTVAGTAPCPNASATVTIAINTPPNAGTNGSATLCTTSAPVVLQTLLGGGPNGGGAWTGPSGAPASGGFDPATDTPGTYTYTVAGTTPCPNDVATVTLSVNTPPDPGTNGTITLCSTDVAASLFAQLGGTPDAGGTWSGPSPVVGGMINPATMNAGVYTYTVVGTAPCPDETATVTVTINTPSDPGTNGTITLCSTDAAASLFAQLGGTPDAGGTWTGPSPVVGGMINPATMNAGVYTYTVVGTAPCPDETATVTVTINTPPDPGTNGTITLCSTNAAASLFAQLGGTPDAGGTWTGPSPVVGGMIDPSTMSAGVYTYTVTGTAPCPNETATVTVAINTPPDPGTNGTITLCSTDAAASLFAQLGGTPDAGGTWSGPSPVVGGMINPATMSAGVYTYTVTGTAPCPDETATVTVTINTPPDPGTNGTITLCSTDAAASLFAQLGGTPDAGGTWSGPSAVVGGMINPATMSAGVYTYTVAGTAPCPDETATVTVTINTPPDPGTPGTITLCSTDAAASLFAQLGGTPDAGGTWTGPSPVVVGMINPATMNAGVYTYTVAGTAPCPDETATVTVAINTPPDPGTNGTITLCSTDAAASLFAQLGGTPDAGGTWTGPSPVVGGMINPATMSAGVYTYTVAGTAPCPNETATVTVTINTPPDPGTNGTITLCSTDAAASLFAQLGGTPDAGGTWSGPSPVVGGVINPATMSAGVYTYTVTGTAPCPDETATVTVTINTPPDPGTPGTITLCSTDAAISLFAQLGGTPDAGGTWTGPSPVVGGVINPATMSAGVYTYTVTGTAPCPDETATVTVTINTPPDPGTPGTITLCSTDAAASLFAQLGGTPDAVGTWTGPSPVVGGMINPATMSAGVYTYTVTGTAPCPDETATVTVTINTPPDPGTNGTITLCSTDAAASLFAQLGGTPDAGGTWTGPSPVVGGMINPATMSAGVYTYTVTGAAPCVNANSTVTVSINAPPNAGTNGSTAVCDVDAAFDLFTQLGGGPQTGGSWSFGATAHGNSFTPGTDAAGVYTYTVAGTAPCPADVATVSIVVNAMPDAGIDGGLTLCSSSPMTALNTGLNGTPDAGGTWSGPGGATSNGTFTPGMSATGIYTYTMNGIAPCPAVSATVDVNVVTNPDAGTPGSATLCASDMAVLLFSELGGTPDAGGTWSGPSAVVGGQYDPATMNPGVYTYTITVPPPCVNASSTVTITEIAPPNAGTDGAMTLCISSPAASLFAALGGGAQAGGTWSGPSPVAGGMFNPATMSAGVYTYTVNGTTPCPNDQSTVTVTVVTAPDAGTPGSATLCATDAAVDLFAELGGSPDLGGSWSGPSAVVGGQYDPATMNPGVYTYTITVPPPCVNASSTVTITEVAPPNAGTDGAITLCISSPAASLFAALGGGAQAGGTWSGPSPVAGGMFNPATMSAGVYTYTVNGTTPCPNDQAQVTVTVVAAPDAGAPGSATLCATDAALDLFAELGGSPDLGGTWSGPSVVVGGQYDPATMNPGVYTYTITVPPPCVNASSTVNITEVAPPNAGTDGAMTLCISSPAASLFAALGGGAQAGGTWSGPSPVAGGMFNPATMSAGVYTYTVNGTTPCPNDQSTVTVTVVAAPDAGTPGSATLCATDAAVDLFAELGGSPDLGGSWSGPSAVVGGQYDPATMNPGVYTYTITVPPPCVNASSTVNITEVAPPNAGTDGAMTLCISSPAASLFAALGGGAQAGGTWIGPSPVAGGMFNPATMSAGVYTYTVNGTTPCPNDQSTVTVTVVTEPNPGTDNAITLCATDASIGLFAQLGGTPDAGGTWSGPSAIVGDVFDPATMLAGVYTYTIIVPPPCASVSASITVSVVAPSDAGIDGALTLCVTSPAAALFNSLGGTPDLGGAWSGPSPVMGGLFDPATMNAGVYTYTINGTTPCPNDAATVTVTVVSEPDPGGPGFLTVCSSDAAQDLFSSLEGSPDQGGGWALPNGTVFDGQFDPGTMASGVYTYTINVPPPCSSVSQTVTVDVITPPNAGIDGAVTLCFSNAVMDLFTVLGGTPAAGGAWTNSTGAPFSGSFDPTSDAPGAFTYTVQGITPCPADVATVTTSVTQLPNPGADDILNLCISGDPVDLFPVLGSADAGGTWIGPTGISNGIFTPGASTAGDYTYTVAGVAPCPSASAVITVHVLSNADAGVDGGTTLCASDAPYALFSALQGTPDAGGSWFAPNGSAVGDTFDPGAQPAGIYTYILFVPAPCLNDTAQVEMTLVQPVDAGLDGNATLCSNDASLPLFSVLGGSPDPAGSWNGPGGASTGLFDPHLDAPGSYIYTVQATAPCPNMSATVDVDVNPLPDAGTNGSITLCPESAPVQLFDLLGGTPMSGGTWTGPGGVASNGIFDPATSPQGVYTYTVFGILPCPNASASSTATVFLIAPPNAGPDAVSCTLSFTLNATGNWASGTWTGPAGITFADATSSTSSITAINGGSYTLTWSVVSTDGCVTQDAVTITLTSPIVPVVATTDAICNGACDGTATVDASGGNTVGGVYSYQWSNGIAGNVPTAVAICAGTYSVIVFDANNCNATADFIIGEPVPLVIDAIVDNDETCPGSCDGMVTIVDTQGAQYSINGGDTFQSSAMFFGLCPGEFDIVMLDANGCIASGDAVVGTPAPVVAGFTYAPETLLVNNPLAQFVNASSPNAVNFSWDFAGLGTSEIASPTFTFPGGLGNSYMVCLTVTDANDCPDEYCAPVEVFDVLIVHVPNVFTPNEDDVNEGFCPIFNLEWAVEDYDFTIFDRWGELLFQSGTVHEKWSGFYRSEVVKEEVYVWKMKCRDKLTHEWIERIGHVTVLK